MPQTESRELSFQLNSEEGALLVDLARKAVEHYLTTGKSLDAPENLPKKLLLGAGGD
jgi:AMMECR1 domain-containing protein